MTKKHFDAIKYLITKKEKFPTGVIKNLLIERGQDRTITNYNQVKVLKSQFKSIESYL